jgi:hypothetical protein
MMSDRKSNTQSGPDYSEAPAVLPPIGLLNILCVIANLIVLDRICHGLEMRGNIIVEIAVTVEDALSLIRYIDFDLIVCENLLGHIDSNGFLHSAWDAGIPTPFIIYSGGSEEGDGKTLLTHSPVYYLGQVPTLPSEINNLYCLIMQISSRDRGQSP